jgi:hypothetical protein
MDGCQIGGEWDRERKLEQLAGMVDDPARAFQVILLSDIFDSCIHNIDGMIY